MEGKSFLEVMIIPSRSGISRQVIACAPSMVIMKNYTAWKLLQQVTICNINWIL
jgi:hypothetical protein